MKQSESMQEYKQAVGIKAAGYVKSGQIVGLGTGSTAAYVIKELGRRVREEKLSIDCVTTSFQSMNLAIAENLRVYPVQVMSTIDISIDGADEIDPRLNLMKGGGAAHAMEKLVHALSSEFIVVADVSKKVDRLGSKFAVPVEVIPVALRLAEKRLKDLGATEIAIRQAVKKDGPVVTDNGNFVLDARFVIEDPFKLEGDIDTIPCVVENGIFSKRNVKVKRVLLAGPDGVEEITA